MYPILLILALSLMNAEDIKVSSPAFKDQESIPSKYTCEGENINPELRIGALPEGTESLVLIMDDPDAPMGTFVHWVMWNITPSEVIKENSSPGKEGNNGAGKKGYTGPCPPSGEHRYYFKVYALDATLIIDGTPGKAEVEEAMEGHVLASGQLMGKYRKK